MNTAVTTADDDTQPWSLESTADPDIQRVKAHIGGLHCSLCTGTIESALGKKSGVRRVAVSLTQHRQDKQKWRYRHTRQDQIHSQSLQKYCRQDTGLPHPIKLPQHKHKAGKAANQHNRAK
ncbi:heavy metal-associated domain-containing protein [Marinobacter salsuginis]|uniref:Uncharacterized protein n=1 Tax=Marinobacter salsuginis TaxID=418719 RepID=A0A5M3Q5S6_9GAMM|nr:heavy metal-associated domain-containing protein [Marinobacter salsuginis]GBO90431.1 hypothetical protein MSSD14B_40990 [Marinobacter salsuginis]